MTDKNNFKNLIIYVLVISLFIIAFFVIKPVITAIIYGLLLAYITYPVYKFILKRIKNEFISAFIVCAGLFVVIISLIIAIIGSLFKQAINIYFYLKNIDIASELIKAFPFLTSSELSSTLINNINSSISNLIFNFLEKFNTFILNIPELALKFIVVIFVFFFALKDGEKAINYIKSISPLKKETEEKFFKRFKDVTNSVLLGQILVGVAQGTVAGIGFFVFGVPNALLLTLLSIGVSIIPILGPWLVWLPVNVFLLISGKPEIAIGFLIYNLFLTSLIDNVLRPLFVSKKTEINTAVVIAGMIGGFLVFGILGLIIGPLIISYVLLVLELYKKKNIDENPDQRKL